MFGKDGTGLKILQINAVYGYSSTGRMVKEFDETFEDCGFVSLSAVTRSNTAKDSIRIIGSRWDQKLHALLSRVFGKQGYFSHRATRNILTWIEQERPDVVHLHNLHSNYIHIPMLLKFLAKQKIATVVTLHDCFFFTGKCTHYIAEGCTKWQTGCHHCEKLKADNVSWFLDCTASMWRDKKDLFSNIPRLAVVGVSDWITNEAKRSFLHTATIVKRIYNGVDISCFSPMETAAARQALGLSEAFTVLGVAQRWVANKGLSVFTELATRLPDTAFVLVGEVPSDAVLPDNIQTVGTTDNPETLAAYYAAADVFLNPSLYETFGKTTAEALACGTPVIGNNATAMPELIRDGCGILVEDVNDTEQVLQALQTIRTDGKAAYSEQCRAFAVSQFDKNDSNKQYIQLYEELLQY